MTTTTAKKPATRTTTRKPAPAKVTKPEPKAPQQSAPKPAAKPEPKTLVEALTTGQAVLVNVRANGTKRSLPYLAPGTPERSAAEAVAARNTKGETVAALAEDLNVSLATARRFLTNLSLAHDVEAGKHNRAWTNGTKEVVVHTVTAKPAKA